MSALSNVYSMIMLGCNNLVGIATRYVLGGSGIESRCERIGLHFSKPTLGTTQTYNVRRVMLGGTAAGAWR